MRAIIPCAGKGTRVNMLLHQAKEYLPDPESPQGYPIIDYSLELCEKYDLDPLIISRKEKTGLNEYLSEYETLIIEPEGEWPETILKSEHLWDKHNILILPDTRFEPTDVIQHMKNDLENGALFSIALHSVTDSSKWCVVKDYELIEKPIFNEKSWAMGLIGWDKTGGGQLFKTLATRGAPCHLIDTSFQYLDSFKDITRG
jgi:dTDP-glucose pyrophosphorylase